jgi:hypothetical protein
MILLNMPVLQCHCGWGGNGGSRLLDEDIPELQYIYKRDEIALKDSRRGIDALPLSPVSGFARRAESVNSSQVDIKNERDRGIIFFQQQRVRLGLACSIAQSDLPVRRCAF